jgi:hypothetical protein
VKRSVASQRPPATWRVMRARDVGGDTPVLVAADEEAMRKTRRWKAGDEMTVDVRKPRNLKHHRKFWILLKIVVENNEAFDSEEAVLYALKAALGRGKWVEIPKASRPMFIPESISFAAMDQDEFDNFYVAAVNAVLKHWLPVGMDELEVEIATRF